MNSNLKKTLIISGISVAAVSIGFFLGYRFYKRWNKEVIEGKHNTILIDKEETAPEEVESVGWDEPTASNTSQEWRDYNYVYGYGDSGDYESYYV